jgi:hypothetical protein
MKHPMKTGVVKSVCGSDAEALVGILALHNAGQPFELDVTYSKGGFYRDGKVPQPLRKFDLHPELPDVEQADCRHLPFKNGTVSSIICDLPFMFGLHGTNRPDNKTPRGYSDPATLNGRFSQFASFYELREVYQGGLDEFARILKPKGLLAFKCCDFTDRRTTMTHCEVWRWATERGFYAKDLIIRTVSAGRAWNPKLVQRHSRKFHSYFWVFLKS